MIERLAREGNPKAVKFAIPRMGDNRPDFSFSGLKTAVQKYVRDSGLRPVTNGEPSQAVKNLAASFQSTVIRSLVTTMERVAQENSPRTLIVAGGVACNGALREAADKAARQLGVPVYFPSPHLSTDNAAMIAAAGTVKLQAGERADWDLNADVMLRLQNIDVEDANEAYATIMKEKLEAAQKKVDEASEATEGVFIISSKEAALKKS